MNELQEHTCSFLW